MKNKLIDVGCTFCGNRVIVPLDSTIEHSEYSNTVDCCEECDDLYKMHQEGVCVTEYLTLRMSVRELIKEKK